MIEFVDFSYTIPFGKPKSVKIVVDWSVFRSNLMILPFLCFNITYLLEYSIGIGVDLVT